MCATLGEAVLRACLRYRDRESGYGRRAGARSRAREGNVVERHDRTARAAGAARRDVKELCPAPGFQGQT